MTKLKFEILSLKSSIRYKSLNINKTIKDSLLLIHLFLKNFDNPYISLMRYYNNNSKGCLFTIYRQNAINLKIQLNLNLDELLAKDLNWCDINKYHSSHLMRLKLTDKYINKYNYINIRVIVYNKKTYENDIAMIPEILIKDIIDNF